MNARIRQYLTVAGGVCIGTTAHAAIIHTEVNLTASAGQWITFGVADGSAQVEDAWTSGYGTLIGVGLVDLGATLRSWRAEAQATARVAVSHESMNYGPLFNFARAAAIGADLPGTGTTFSGPAWSWNGQMASSFSGMRGGNFQMGSPGYLGIHAEGNGFYGWAQITILDDGIKLHSWACDDTGAAISAGAIPAPAPLCLLGLPAGASGVRRRRSA